MACMARLSLNPFRTRSEQRPARRLGWRALLAFACLATFIGLQTARAGHLDSAFDLVHKCPKAQVERLDFTASCDLDIRPVSTGIRPYVLISLPIPADRAPTKPLFRDHPTRAPPSLLA